MIKRISASIICRFDGEEFAFKNGKVLVEHEFDRKYMMVDITIEEDEFVFFFRRFR